MHFTGQDGVAQGRSPQSSSTNIQHRINQLEGLVVSLMSTLNAKGTETKIEALERAASPLPEAQAVPTAFETDSQASFSDTFGRMSLENAETSYVGSTHWMAILDGVGASLTLPLSVFKRVEEEPAHVFLSYLDFIKFNSALPLRERFCFEKL